MKRYILNFKLIALFIIFSFTLNNCEELEVENLNNPKMEDVLASPADVPGVMESAWLEWWLSKRGGINHVNNTQTVAADHHSVSWGNFAWQDISWEPRMEWNNDPAYGYSGVSENTYNSMYATISQVNDVLYLINEEGMDIGTGGVNNPKMLAAGYFIRGSMLASIGVTYDQGMVAREGDDLAELELQPWQVLIEEGIEDLKAAIEISENNDFSWGGDAINGLTVDNEFIVKMANSYIARYLVTGSRNAEQNETLNWINYDWNDVLTFANNGIDVQEVAPEGQGFGADWQEWTGYYLRVVGWARIDTRIIALMDPDYFVRYPTDSDGLPIPTDSPDFPDPHDDTRSGEAKSDDARLESDFDYMGSHDFAEGRGGWHFTNYRHKRYDATMQQMEGPLYELRLYENELMKAEAMARTGNLSGAADILNDPNNERKTRGGLDDVAVDEKEILRAIFYERDIELINCGYMLHMADMRRRDKMQYGAILHWPVPGSELETLILDIYTYGGVNNADGENTSDGGAWIYDYYHFDPQWSKPSGWLE